MSEKLLTKLKNYKRQIKAMDRAHRLLLYAHRNLIGRYQIVCSSNVELRAELGRLHGLELIPEHLKYEQGVLFDADTDESPVPENPNPNR